VCLVLVVHVLLWVNRNPSRIVVPDFEGDLRLLWSRGAKATLRLLLGTISPHVSQSRLVPFVFYLSV
jgi:hypothetical protein